MFSDLINLLRKEPVKKEPEKRDPRNFDNVLPDNNPALAARQSILADKMVDLAVSKEIVLPPSGASEEDLIRWSRGFILGLSPEDFAKLGFRRADGRNNDKRTSEFVCLGAQITDGCFTDIQRKAVGFEIGVFRAFREAIARKINQMS